ncbi:coproporphyrinogen-III oxidase family protein [Rubinisphaera margarita]|uniref:coproporphyrinogen-III oxidase family protein n=1 Tax=Rubinisphaera margarita TaxID=2909586 RepID=UPI001EE968A8|nr:coproporphyrinogen-III oxidase family protein [Rubinisphaera margarita]MCG6155334.1 coproporphyrinogen III oxidase family protein [Rubinisphaera margarita]
MSTDLPLTESTKTEVGSYFISNYPAYSVWNKPDIAQAREALESPADTSVPFGIYTHIPFCRKRCKFCYFRVYIQQNAKTIQRYVQAIDDELRMLSELPGVKGRRVDFAYFGGGTPSYLSSKQLLQLRDRLSQSVSWETAEEVTFECEPGTLNLEKVRTLKEIGITRVSLGVESFNDKILEINGRAHLSPEVERAYGWIQDVGFPQVNIDLIAGMIGETDENWHRNIDKALELAPDNITIYQMELPYNTIISQEMKETGAASPIADWPTKRRWVSEAMDRLLEAGYGVASGQEFIKNPETDRFLYRDHLFRGHDILPLGVSSFGHLQGIHYQNNDQLEPYIEIVESGELPINRAYVPSDRQKLIREFVLRLKEGVIDTGPMDEKYGVNVLEEFSEALENQERAGYLEVDGQTVRLTRKGLLQVDSLLPEYFEPQYRKIRYT